MNYDYKQTMLSKCLLSGLFAGLIAVGINFVYNYVFREMTSYSLSEVVNVVSIMFSSLIALVVAGALYFLFLKVRNGKLLYTIIFLLLTILGVFGAIETHRSSNLLNQQNFRMLFGGIIMIDGLIAILLIPYFTKHEKLYS